METLGATSAINTDKTGTLTMNEMMVSTIYAGEGVVQRHGPGLRERGRSSPSPVPPVPDFTRRRSGWPSTSDATVGDDGDDRRPDRAALVVLAAKLGVNAEERAPYPRLAAVPFDSAYKFMAAFHRVRVDGSEHVIELVKGGPDVVFRALHPRRRPAQRLAGSDRRVGGPRRSNARMGEQDCACWLSRPPRGRRRAERDGRRPDVLTQDLAFVGMAGMIDPLRAEAKDAVTTALKPGSTCA